MKPPNKIEVILATYLALWLMLITTVTAASPPPNTSRFIDVPENQWFAEAVNKMAELGFINGRALEGNVFEFLPASPITRREFMAIIARMSGDEIEKNVQSTGFPDVPPNAWYAGYIAWGRARGIVQGYDDGGFHPANFITREEVAVVISRYAAYQSIELPIKNTADFHDESTIQPWSHPAVKQMQSAGIVQGSDEGKFHPQMPTRRSEAVQMLYNLWQLT